MSAPPAWLRLGGAAAASQQQQQQQRQQPPPLVAHEEATTRSLQRAGAAVVADYRSSNNNDAASPTSVWSGTVSRSYESVQPTPSVQQQQQSQRRYNNHHVDARSPSPSAAAAAAMSRARSSHAFSVDGRGSRAAGSGGAAVSTHGRRVLRATPAPLLVSSEEAVASRATGGRWAQPHRYSTASSHAGSHASSTGVRSRATTPPPPLLQQQQQQQQHTPYSSRTAATTVYTPLTRQNLRAWEQGQLHVAEQAATAGGDATASPPVLFATEHARSPSSPRHGVRARGAVYSHNDVVSSARSSGGGSSGGDSRRSGGGGGGDSRRGRMASSSQRASRARYSTAATVAPGDSRSAAGATAYAPYASQPSSRQQQQQQLPWWAQTELLHRGLARPASASQANTIAASAFASYNNNRIVATEQSPSQQQQHQQPLVSNESVFVGKHRTAVRSNPLNIWSHESHILRNLWPHNNNNNTTPASPPILFASAESHNDVGGGAALYSTAASAAVPRLVASEPTTATAAVHTTRNSNNTPAVLTSSGSGGGGGSSSSTTTTTTTTNMIGDDKKSPSLPQGSNEGSRGHGGGGGGGWPPPPPPPQQPGEQDEPPLPPPPSALRVRGRTFRTRNLNALHAFSWDRRIYLPAQDGFLAQPFRLFASPRFWEKLDWAVRGSLLCIVPMLILCLEPRTGSIFPLRSSAVALSFWINMPTLGGGLRELYIVLKGFSWSLVLLCIIIAWHPRQTWLVLLLLFLSVFLTSFAVEQTRRISAYTLVLLLMQYIYDNEKTTYRYVVDYFVTLLLALAFGMVSFAVPYIRWASDIAHHYLGVLGDAVSLSVRGMCAGFWVSNPLERQLHVTRLRQLRATITPCISRIATGMSEMGYEPHTGVYTAQMRTRLGFLRHVSFVLESMTQIIEQIADDPALVDTPLCNAFGERMSGEVLRIGAVMDATILRITDLTHLVTAQDMADFGKAVARYQDAMAVAREAVILNNPDYHADHSDILLGFFFFCIEELCESIAAFHEAEVPPNNLVYFLTFPLRDINSLVVACITLRNAIWRRRTITRRLKEAIKLALCIVIAAIFQVYALGNTASPVAGVDIIALVYNRTGGMSFQYASNRLLGTVLGSLTGFLSVQIADGRRWVLYIFVALISFVGAYVQAAPGYYALGNAICNSVISIVTQYRDQTAAMVRIQQNCFAILIYFIVSSLVWPMRGNTKVKMGLDISLRMFRETTYRILRNLDMPEDATEVDRDAGELIAEMNKRIVVQVTNLPGALVEPTMDSAEFPELSWRMLIASQQKLLATLMMMRSAYRTFMSSKIGSGADRTNLSVHWVVLHRISPYMTELSHLLCAAVDIYLWSLSKATIVPTAHLTTIHEGMLHCRRRIIRVYLETIQREVDGSISNATNAGAAYDDNNDNDNNTGGATGNWWEKARPAAEAAAAGSAASAQLSSATSNHNNHNNHNNATTRHTASAVADVSPSSSLTPPPHGSPAAGVVVHNTSTLQHSSLSQHEQQQQQQQQVGSGGPDAGEAHNASFATAGGAARAQRKTRQGAFLGYRLRPEEQEALRSYIETGTLLGNVGEMDQTALNNASFVLDAPDFAATARRRNSNVNVNTNNNAAGGEAAPVTVDGHRRGAAGANAATSPHEPLSALSSTTSPQAHNNRNNNAMAATGSNNSMAMPPHRTTSAVASPGAATINNASMLPPPHPPHNASSHTFASAPLPGAASATTNTAANAATAAAQHSNSNNNINNNATFVGNASGLGNASMFGTRLSNKSMLLAGVHAARRSDPVMGGGDLFTAARPDRAKQLVATAAAAAAAKTPGSHATAAAAAAAEATSAVAAAGAAADHALAIAADAAAAAASGRANNNNNNNSNNTNDNNRAGAGTGTGTPAALPSTPATTLTANVDGTAGAAAAGGSSNNNNNNAVANATFVGAAASPPAAPAAAGVVTPIAAGSAGGLLNSSLALHNRVAQGNVDVTAAAAQHDVVPHTPPLPLTTSAAASAAAAPLANRTFAGGAAVAQALPQQPAAPQPVLAATAVERQSTAPPPPELHAAERATAADSAAAAAAAATPRVDAHATAHEPSVFPVSSRPPSRPPSRAPSRAPSRRPSALQQQQRLAPHVSGSFAALASNNRSLAGRSALAGGRAAAGTTNNSISGSGGGGGGGALSGLLSSIKRMGNKPGTDRFALRDYEEDAEIDRDTYAIDLMAGGGGEHAGLRGTTAVQRGMTQTSPQLAADAGHTSPAGGNNNNNNSVGGVGNGSTLRRSFASALATLRRRGKSASRDGGDDGGGGNNNHNNNNNNDNNNNNGRGGGRAAAAAAARAGASPLPRTRDDVDDDDDGLTAEERDAMAAAGDDGRGGGGGYDRGDGAAARTRDVDEVLDEASNYDAEQGVFILTNRDVHSLEAFLFCIRTLITQVEEFEQFMLQMIHSNEMAKKL